jgi:hypothetical protein
MNRVGPQNVLHVSSIFNTHSCSDICYAIIIVSTMTESTNMMSIYFLIPIHEHEK